MFGSSSRYNYERFNREKFAKEFEASKFRGVPGPGEEAPDFELRTIEGDRVRLRDFHGRKNVVLTFGSATCPQTAASIGGVADLHERFGAKDGDEEFLFVYVREAHPGGSLPSHGSMRDKVSAAAILRDEEEVRFPVLVDDLNGKVHRKYGSLPNPTFLIDKSGRIAFRSLGSRAATLREAIEELHERQQQRGVEHAVVGGGEDTTLPPLGMFLHAHRALERGGNDALENFRNEMGVPGRVALAGGRLARPVAENPGKAIGAIVAAFGAVAFGLWAGHELRSRRFGTRPYDVYRRGKYDDYAVGI